MQQQRLDRQADIIETVLAAHKVQGRILGGAVTPRFIRYDLRASWDTRVQKVIALRDEIAMSLGVSDVRMYRQGHAIRIEVPRDKPAVIRLERLCRELKRVPALTAVLGVDSEGAPLLLRLPSPDVAHMLVSGATGSGKTALLRSIILSLAFFNPQRSLQFILIDPKRRGFAGLATLPHLLRKPVYDAGIAVQLLEGLTIEMERRDREKRRRPALVVVVDELAELRMSGGKALEDVLTRLSQRGREAGIHLILATQRPVATIVGGLVKANLPVRLVGAVASPEDAKVATGIAGTGAERLAGRGDFLLVSHGQIHRFQAAYASQNDARQLIARIQTPSRQQRLSFLTEHRS